jgi:hypothetical protein
MTEGVSLKLLVLKTRQVERLPPCFNPYAGPVLTSGAASSWTC